MNKYVERTSIDWMLKKHDQNREEYQKEESGPNHRHAVDLEEGEIGTLREQKEIKPTSFGDVYDGSSFSLRLSHSLTISDALSK